MTIGLADSVKLLRPAIEREGDTTVEFVLSGIKRGEFQLWRGKESAIVTKMMNVGVGGHLIWIFAGGNLEEIRDKMKPEIENWAKDQGCIRATMTARRGWSKALPDYQQRKQVVLTKEL